MSTIYFIIFVLFLGYIIGTWNSTKEFETPVIRISYILIGTIFITIVTLILFWISKIGVVYPKQEMISEVRKIILLIFVPINGFIVLTQFASMASRVKNGAISKSDLQKSIKILVIILVIMIIVECIYFKNIQYGIIKIINAKM